MKSINFMEIFNFMEVINFMEYLYSDINIYLLRDINIYLPRHVNIYLQRDIKSCLYIDINIYVHICLYSLSRYVFQSLPNFKELFGIIWVQILSLICVLEIVSSSLWFFFWFSE